MSASPQDCWLSPCRSPFPSGSQGAAGQAKGTLSHKGKSVTLAHAYLVTGPDAVDTKRQSADSS